MSLGYFPPTGYKLIELALGRAHLYVHAGGARRWDMCAGAAVLTARGGVIRNLTGGPLHFNHGDPSDLDPREGIFAAASRDLYDAWKNTVASLSTAIPLNIH